MTDLDAIRERHTSVLGRFTESDVQRCECLNAWPCDTRHVLDALDACDNVYIDVCMERDMAMAAYDDARADADRLAEALQMCQWGDSGDDVVPGPLCPVCMEYPDKHKDDCAIGQALAAHDEATR